ncbi:MAG: hypothetical protein ACK5QP_08280 [Chitinophagales bacterium]
MTVINNSGTVLEFVQYVEWDDPGCQNTVNYYNVAIPTGTTPFTLTSGNMFITATIWEPTTSTYANTAFLSPYSCLGTGQTTATIWLGGGLHIMTWTENSSTHDVTLVIINRLDI